MLSTSSALSASGASRKAFWKGGRCSVRRAFVVRFRGAAERRSAGADQPDSKLRPSSLACRKAATAPDFARPDASSAPGNALDIAAFCLGAGARPTEPRAACAARNFSAAAAMVARGFAPARPAFLSAGWMLEGSQSSGGSAGWMLTTSKEPQFSPGHSSRSSKVIQLPTFRPGGGSLFLVIFGGLDANSSGTPSQVTNILSPLA
mmetsp:Transcript_97449/g.231911  ORF Transcript_97449/g.231911 Transcript_97449/m.231911 type:complete len:205 (+) Transcript_97449:1439-2053(+)